MGVTEHGALEMRQATPDDIDSVMEILGESARWLSSKGLSQWSNWYEGREKVAKQVDAKHVWLLFEDDQLAGTVTIDPIGDADFWTPDQLAEPAVYVSKLAIRRSHAGRELGQFMLDWAGDYARRHGYSIVRLDAWRTNHALHRYYCSRGWTPMRTVSLPHRKSGALFQKLVAQQGASPVSPESPVSTEP